MKAMIALTAALIASGCSKPELPPPSAPAPASERPAAKPAPAPVIPEPPNPTPRETRAAPAKPVAAPAKPKPSSPAPKSEPAPRAEPAATKPTTIAPAAAARLVNRVDPDFPREAVQSGVDKGNVKARMTLDETGAVTRVEVLEATPRRIFDRAVVRALSQWKFDEGAAGRTVDTEVDFRR